MKCRYCTHPCIKKGIRPNGKQKYLCRNCNSYQQASYTSMAHLSSFNALISRMVKHGSGIRDIAHVTQTSTTTVMRRILTVSLALKPPSCFQSHGDYEMDEMHSYVWKENRKTDTYIAYAIHRESGKTVHFTVGGRNKAVLGTTVEKILSQQPKSIRTDRWAAYPCIIPKEMHVTTKRKINHIERHHLTLRTRLKRLGHNRLCHSKSTAMLEACLRIYFWG